MITFLFSTSTNAVQINYKGGAGPAMIGLLGNEVQMMFVTFSSAVTFARQGRVRMLGVISPERNAALPDVPTMKESGVKGLENFTFSTYTGLFAPAKLPPEILAKLNAA